VLTTALFAELGWVTYYGPNLASIGEDIDHDYTIDHLLRATSGLGPFAGDRRTQVAEADTSKPGVFKSVGSDAGMRVTRPGYAEGIVFGGNLGTLFLLQGTRYWPHFDEDVLLCIEEDDLAGEYTLIEALRRIYSLLMQPGLARVTGLVLGRFQADAQVRPDLLDEGLLRISRLSGCPIVVDAPFGHTSPQITLPIGGRGRLDATSVRCAAA
jgi:muramoyltetrapeptide carboxypeptidase